ncbi:MAG TPA: amino acid permease [Vicinamibacterales bacterium]|jgi:basic amino acid/polyamine antiporter, APA family|nr:amino acid permease [Vicinamibacterales bacterium]
MIPNRVQKSGTTATHRAPDEADLIRGLTGSATTALVVGTVIGTGVFIKTAIMAQDTGSASTVLLAWVAAGVLSMCGALTYAELGAMLPHAGGEYVYLRHAYGELAAFLFGWMRFVVGGTGSIAILGVGFATFLSAIVPITSVWASSQFVLLGQTIDWQFGSKQLVAVAAIMFFAVINCLTVVVGGRVQSLLTVLKLGGIAAVVLGVFFKSNTADWSHLAATDTANSSGAAAFGLAMLAALWAYDGWNNMPMAAGEVKDPGRNVPIALIGGMAVVTLIYCIANLAYFYALPFSDVLTSNSTRYRDALPVATKAAQTVFGESGGRLISLAFIFSALGALNGSTLTGARVPYAMARDGVFFSRVALLSHRTRVPVYALLLQAVWASVLAISGTFDQLSDYVIFASWIFYGLVTSSVFVLRRKMPDAPRPYKTLGYPIVPLVFVLVAAWLVINTLVNRPVESIAGLILIALGLPIYLYYRRTAPFSV